MKSTNVCVAFLALLLVFAASSQAAIQTIYFDNFDGPVGTDLNSLAPDTTTGGAVWDAGSGIDADGTITYDAATEAADYGSSAYLPFTPVSGYIYA